MRHSRHMGRGGGAGPGAPMNITGGPLITEHLKDIDLELDLLKRKREMLEQQQLFGMGPQPLMPPQRPFQPLGGPNRDFSHLYSNDGPEPHRKIFGKKRPADNNWHQDSYHKRSTGQGPRVPVFAGPSAQNQRPFSGSRHAAPPIRHPHNKPYIGHKIANQKPKPVNTALNKVTKPSKTFSPLNTIQSHPAAQRKNLVAAATAALSKVQGAEREALRLLPDKIPTKQMTGRLELALGSILKDIRELCNGSPKEDLLRTTSLQRLIKQAIRERIRAAMLGKVVGSTGEIMIEYRTMFPKETDVEIITMALDAYTSQVIETTRPPKEPLSVPLVVGDKPDEYFRANITKLARSHLEEMFTKLEEIYMPVDEGEVSQENSAGDNADKSAQIQAERAKKIDLAVKEAEEAASKLGSVKLNDYKYVLPRLLKSFIPSMLKLLEVNAMYRSAVADITANTRSRFDTWRNHENPEDLTILAPSEPSIKLPYYVKVFCKPQLPRKKQMQRFLEQFSPSSIKKHKTIHNLLFVGFADKSNFDNILKANGTVIARSTLNIRVCEPANSEKPNGDTSTNEVGKNGENQERKDDVESSEGDLLGTDLDNQITDLLTSIRTAEEKAHMQNGTKNETQETKMDEDKEVIEITKDADTANDVQEIASNAQETPNDAQETPNGQNSEKKAPEPSTDDIAVINEEVQDKNETATVEAETKQEDNTNSENKPESTEDTKSPATDEKTEKTNGDKEPEAENSQDSVNSKTEEPVAEKQDQVAELKSAPTGRSTPTRSSSRLAGVAPTTPSTIRTRRASRLAQN
ncbi:uncharacterized protein LOC142984147 isoform X2 [Anticarsia gemmatalis]|uniref:uncharacterized protein LOC142984147 isoform X2 n=1 Tax=Anticarsia gemmatalis TaxID=129554 RepID=UPI003F76E060